MMPTVSALPQLSDAQLLEAVQRRAVRFFWEKADPRTGLVNDRARNSGVDDFTVASIASTGYGLAALPIAVERHWLGKEEAAARARTTLRFLLSMPHQHGWLYHFVDRRTGERVWNSELSSIDTALLVIGALACGQYFARNATTADVTALANTLYERMDWQWMLTNGGTRPDKKVISHGWKPESDWIEHNYDHYSEAILLYLLGMGAAKKPLPPDTWDAIRRPLQIYGGLQLLQAGPIFIHQMPAGFYPLRNRRDRLGYDYWASSVNAMLMHRQYGIDHARNRKTHREGFWGLNASDGPDGYKAYGAPDGPEDGTVSPTGAISAITFNPQLAISAARAFYDRQGDKLWGDYGFGNAFNLDRNWFGPDVIGIDLGMVLLAIENERSGLIWKLIESHASTPRAWAAAGLHTTVEAEPRAVHLIKSANKKSQ